MKPFLLLLVFLLFPAGAGAAVDLFSATVPIADESPEARRQAMAEALRKVLVKASGQPLSPGREKLQKLLATAEDQVQEFRYLAAPPGQEGGEPGKLLWARFDRKAVSRMLRELGLQLWERGRPELLLWLAVDEKGKRHLVDPERESDLLEAARSAAEDRGVNLILPLMDLQDRNALNVGDLWMGHVQSIRDASARYGQAVPLAGRLSHSGGRWQGKWLLLLSGEEREFERSAASAGTAIRKGIHRAVDLLASHYQPAVAGGESSLVQLRFVNVQDVAGYARLRNLLRSLGMVSSVKPLQAGDDQLVFEVRVRGGRAALENQLSLQSDLAPAVDIPEDGGQGLPVETLSYSLRY